MNLKQNKSHWQFNPYMWEKNGERSSGICFNWPSLNCSFLSASIGHVSCCPETKTNCILVGISGKKLSWKAGNSWSVMWGKCLLHQNLWGKGVLPNPNFQTKANPPWMSLKTILCTWGSFAKVCHFHTPFCSVIPQHVHINLFMDTQIVTLCQGYCEQQELWSPPIFKKLQ